MRKKILSIFISLGLIFGTSGNTSYAAVKIGATCTKAGATATVAGKKYTCIQSGKKLIWNLGGQFVVNSTYELTKLKAYNNIRAAADRGNLDKVSIVYNVSKFFPKDLLELYKSQVEYSSKLYSTFFNKKETKNIYLYTEKDTEYLSSERLFAQDLPSHLSWFDAWSDGRDQQHNLGLAAWYMQYPTGGPWQGHAGLLVYSKATTKSLRKYAIQVLPHEYWHVIQDYYFRPKWEQYILSNPNRTLSGQDFYDLIFPPTFREGSANTISFAMASNSSNEYLELYSDFIKEKKNQTEIKLFKTLTSTSAITLALKKIENRRLFSEAHESSYSLGSLMYEWVIAEYGFNAYRRLIENQLIGDSFEDNVKASLGISLETLYKGASQHILSAFSQN